MCDSIDVLRLYVSEGVRMLTTYAHIARPIFMCDGWTAEGGPSARPRKNAGHRAAGCRSARSASGGVGPCISDLGFLGGGIFEIAQIARAIGDRDTMGVFMFRICPSGLETICFCSSLGGIGKK